VTLELVERHLAGLTGDDYLLDRYHAVASGGSSGRRGIFVWSWESWGPCWLGFVRYALRERLRHPEAAARPLVMAAVAAEHATHMSRALTQTFSNPPATVVHMLPVTLPLDEIVAGLNKARPEVVVGFPSALHALAFEGLSGRLSIAPKAFVGVGEPLLPEIRAALAATWDAQVHNWWGCSESGPVAISCGHGPGMHLSDDLVLVEPVDEAGRPVPAGVRAAKVYLTNLFNHALPLIRYELTDEVTLLDEQCPCGSAHRRIEDIQGRLDESFFYPGAGRVHPHVFRSPLGRQRNVVEYQVVQTSRGAAISICCQGAVDLGRLRREIAAGLERLGLTDAEISIAAVHGLERQASGKLKRFVRLAADLAG
jgi:phenylacetate-coenzyme A ligase PaaK-like adenylate-forming protein